MMTVYHCQTYHHDTVRRNVQDNVHNLKCKCIFHSFVQNKTSIMLSISDNRDNAWFPLDSLLVNCDSMCVQCLYGTCLADIHILHCVIN